MFGYVLRLRLTWVTTRVMLSGERLCDRYSAPPGITGAMISASYVLPLRGILDAIGYVRRLVESVRDPAGCSMQGHVCGWVARRGKRLTLLDRRLGK